ncbi:alpha/beta-hydrolase [Daldinia sp. FL1419]|nr:alpha/beta-hydrolase [Daldinia sp. FL1419]
MDSFQRKTVTTTRGFTYSYYVSKPNSSRPTLLLQHGFPDDAHLWDKLARKLTDYHLIVPDLLGYSNTSKPTDPAVYNYAGQCDDLTEILDAENVEKVVSVGHDYGAFVAQSLYIYHPERVQGLILLGLGYVLPSTTTPTLEETNAQFEKEWGYPAYAYQELFVSDEGPKILKENLERFYDVMHGAPRDWMKQIWCQRGEMERRLRDPDWKIELRSYAQDPAFRRAFIERLRRDGFEGPLCYYKATHSNIQSDTVKDFDKDRFIVRVPVLNVSATQDPMCRPEQSVSAKEGGYLPDLEEHTVECSHWVPLEKADEAAELMKSFLQRRFPA